MRRIGILGGMGPEATVLLMQKLIAAVPARDDADHIPLIVDQNPQVPSRIRFLIEGTGEDPGPVLAAMAAGLERAGAEALAMPCNTAHHFAPAIRAAVEIPFLDMVAMAADRARTEAGSGGKVGILASPAVRKVGLFDAALARVGLKAVYPDDEAAMLAAIRSIKAEGASDAARVVLKGASAALLGNGARVQMIACTEFSLIAESVAQSATVFDTLDVLVSAIKDFAQDRAEERPATAPQVAGP
ncbi:aspartate/glutamate racemase family protein [Defluviimonas sp. SAOS-178_SWC]|uniref:aspartate/glutamate racemase family protein n=1 Tax=Defluviimonas sp. SAOS-178_SWC TaxID=3121287 RepID=UPI0032215DC2